MADVIIVDERADGKGRTFASQTLNPDGILKFSYSIAKAAYTNLLDKGFPYSIAQIPQDIRLNQYVRNDKLTYHFELVPARENKKPYYQIVVKVNDDPNYYKGFASALPRKEKVDVSTSEMLDKLIESLRKDGYVDELPNELIETVPGQYILFNKHTGEKANHNASYTYEKVIPAESFKCAYYKMIINVYNDRVYSGIAYTEKYENVAEKSSEQRLQSWKNIEEERQKRLEEKQRLEEENEMLAQKAAEFGINETWARIMEACPIDSTNEYLAKHGLSEWAETMWTPSNNKQERLKYAKHFGAFQDDKGNIIVPMYDEKGNPCNCQKIYYTQSRKDTGKPGYEKAFLAHPGHVPAAGRFAYITGHNPDTVFVCEGWATGMAISLCTDNPVMCAMSCGNLEKTTQIARNSFGRTSNIVVVADNDRNQPLEYNKCCITSASVENAEFVESSIINEKTGKPMKAYQYNDTIIPTSEMHAWNACRKFKVEIRQPDGAIEEKEKAGADCVFIIPEAKWDANDFWTHGKNLKSMLDMAKFYAQNHSVVQDFVLSKGNQENAVQNIR